MTEPEPMTPERTDRVLANTFASAERHGLWLKICNRCLAQVGGRLAEYGEPTATELSRLVCPQCENGIAHEDGFHTEFVAPDADGPTTPKE